MLGLMSKLGFSEDFPVFPKIIAEKVIALPPCFFPGQLYIHWEIHAQGVPLVIREHTFVPKTAPAAELIASPLSALVVFVEPFLLLELPALLVRHGRITGARREETRPPEAPRGRGIVFRC